MEGIQTRSFTGSFLLSPDDLTHGKLQALQVSINGNPVVFVPVDDRAPKRRHAVGESTAAPHGGRVLAGPMGHGS